MGETSDRMPKASPMRLLCGYWLPLLVWCAAIFIQSSFAVPDVAPRWPDVDKIIHVMVYAVLGILFFRVFNMMAPWQGRIVPLVVTATLAATLYGALDEWHQSFVPARSAETMDLVADAIGGFFGAGIYGLIIYLRKKASV